MAARRAPARRAPAAERRRDPDRSRDRILESALVEFGDHGFAGARTAGIARRAGVNPQLITYYFGGKSGLYQALTERWRAESAQISDPDVPLAEVVAGFVRTSLTHRSWTRLLVWQALVPPEEADDAAGADDPDFFRAMIESVRTRQDRGEIAAELDPATVLTVLFSAALAPVVLPQLTREATGAPPGSPESTEHYVEALRAVVERLR